VDAWAGFFSAQVGASAALAGLLFVGVSIKQQALGKAGDLRYRVLQAVAVLAAVFVASTLLLIPGQPVAHAGVEVLAVGGGLLLLAGSAVGQILWGGKHIPARYLRWYRVEAGAVAASVLLFGWAGLRLLAGTLDGLVWLVSGMLLCYFVAIAAAWVFMVDILPDTEQAEMSGGATKSTVA
jgi:modulator of FtsH protease